MAKIKYEDINFHSKGNELRNLAIDIIDKHEKQGYDFPIPRHQLCYMLALRGNIEANKRSYNQIENLLEDAVDRFGLMVDHLQANAMGFKFNFRGLERSDYLWMENIESPTDTQKIFPETVELCTNCMDVNRTLIYSGHIIKSILNPHMAFVVCFGEHQAYCDLDDAWTKNIGFYAKNALGCFPLGYTAAWAQIIGDTQHNPRLAKRVTNEEKWWND